MCRWRYWLLVSVLSILPVLAVWHVANIQVVPDRERGFQYLQRMARAFSVSHEVIPAYRGVITDRRGESLAISTPVAAVYLDTQHVSVDSPKLKKLAAVLDKSYPELVALIEKKRGRPGFEYLKRQVMPEVVKEVMALKIPGVKTKREYRRFYPAGEVVADLVGDTDPDERGIAGLELAYNSYLAGEDGSKLVHKSRRRNVIINQEVERPAKAGKNLQLSIDLRLQYVAYRELKAAVKANRAASGSVVMMDVRSGEVLAIANYLAPQQGDTPKVVHDKLMWNGALITPVEPGSTMKPFTVLAAVESGKYQFTSTIDTNPGTIKVGNKLYRDHSNYQIVDMTKLLVKSSQVATAKIALNMEPAQIRNMFARAGLGEQPGTGFPGERRGSLKNHQRWAPVTRANYAFGYGIEATPVQLAQAYTVIAGDGMRKPVSLLKIDKAPEGERVIDAQLVRDLRKMLVEVVSPVGTARRAAIPMYRVAGKTGTVHKVERGKGYHDNRYVSLFAGMVPADNPRLVTVVVIDDARGKDYYGGAVAAPVFSRVTANALRIMKIPPGGGEAGGSAVADAAAVPVPTKEVGSSVGEPAAGVVAFVGVSG